MEDMPAAQVVVSRLRATAEAATAAGLPLIKVTDDGQRLHLVSQRFIDDLRSYRPRRPLHRLSNERLLRVVHGDEAKLAILVDGFEAAQRVRDMEKDILQQYSAMGHAYFVMRDNVEV